MDANGVGEPAGVAEPVGESDSKRHPIQVVSLRTGLSKDVLRAWERRYQVVEPARTDTGRRLYSDRDIDYLRLLRKASGAGRSLKQMAALSMADLAKLVEEDDAARELQQAESADAAVMSRPGLHVEGADETASDLITECLAAVETLDHEAVHETLSRAVVILPPSVLAERMIAPLMQRIGQLWWEQRLNPRHEHLASTAVQATLDQVIGTLVPHGSGRPHLVSATPNGQRHEIGAMLVAVTAAAAGWRVTYLGADLPVQEIAAAAVALEVQAVAMSLVHPEDDPELPVAIRQLRQLLVPDTRLFAGGRAAFAYQDALEDAGAEVFTELAGLRQRLLELRGAIENGSGGNESGTGAPVGDRGTQTA
jgi:DNA-binding transcriptional MerR regulator/methylmalonyl-CoA mutase cobalamin-binding subunit